MTEDDGGARLRRRRGALTWSMSQPSDFYQESLRFARRCDPEHVAALSICGRVLKGSVEFPG